MSQYTVDLTSKAIKDYEEAFDWYEDQKKGLGFDFFFAINRNTRNHCRTPAYLPILARKCPLQKVAILSLSRFFKIDEDNNAIAVFAILHEKRHPTAWKKRLN